MKSFWNFSTLIGLSLVFLGAAPASAFEIGSWRLDGHILAGSNQVQNTYYGAGIDFYTYIEDHLAAGVGAYYTMGSDPTNDREMGAGPFVSYSYPILDFLVPSIREDLDYVDERDPVQILQGNSWVTGYQANYGMASITSVAMYVYFLPNFGVGVGYKFAFGLNNSSLERDHSGVFFGLALSF
jgi:hypothetical protein